MQPENLVSASVPTTLLIGYGEVGRAFADAILAAGSRLTIVDPAYAGAGDGGVLGEVPASLEGIDLVIAVIPSSASLASAEAAAGKAGSFIYIDLSSSSQDTMRRAADRFAGRPSRFVDGAIMGSVNLHGARTPVTLAGRGAGEAAAMMGRMNFEVAVLAASEPGDASALKLLRSVVMKGLEAAAMEAFLAARAMGLSRALRDNLLDVGRAPFPELLDAIVRTHVLHAPRRAREVAAAVEQIEEKGLAAPVARAVLEAFEASVRLSCEAPSGSPRSADAALDWLAERA